MNILLYFVLGGSISSLLGKFGSFREMVRVFVWDIDILIGIMVYSIYNTYLNILIRLVECTKKNFPEDLNISIRMVLGTDIST